MKQYLDILERCYHYGERKPNRTGIDTFVLPPQMFVHDMYGGFPLVTTKKVAKKTMLVELEGFIGGITDKQWYKDRGCKVWNEWSNSTTRPDGVSAEDWHDLGPIYGYQWRGFNDPYIMQSLPVEPDHVFCDQLGMIVDVLKTNPNDRRMVCSAWNPPQHAQMALPPCHVLWNVQHINGKLHLHWHQRSCDMFLGVPFNIASYAMLLMLLCRETGMVPGQLSATLMDCHIYENHLDQIRTQLGRTPRPSPQVTFKEWNGIFDWKHDHVEWHNYNPHPPIKAKVAV